jgi:putative ABC transport system permease protein
MKRFGPGARMFTRLLARALGVRRGRALTAFFAVVVAAAVATATLDLYTDVQAKLHKEFRSYGANVVITAKSGGSLPPDALARVDAVVGSQGLAAPFAFVVARTADGSPVVVAGTDWQRVRKLDKWWAVSSWPERPSQALLGVRAARALAPRGKPLALSFHGKAIEVTPAGTLQTGAGEDSRIYLSLADFTAWTGLEPSIFEVAVSGGAPEVNAAIGRLSTVLPEAKVEPIRQIVEAETRVLGKTRAALLASTLIIILTAALCMLATLTASVLDRRRDFAVMKALGASRRMVEALFAAEAGLIGAAGALAGFAVGVGIAAWIGRVNFHASIAPRFSILPAVLGGSVLLALASALVPMSLLSRVQPASILRGE